MRKREIKDCDETGEPSNGVFQLLDGPIGLRLRRDRRGPSLQRDRDAKSRFLLGFQELGSIAKQVSVRGSDSLVATLE